MLVIPASAIHDAGDDIGAVAATAAAAAAADDDDDDDYADEPSTCQSRPTLLPSPTNVFYSVHRCQSFSILGNDRDALFVYSRVEVS